MDLAWLPLAVILGAFALLAILSAVWRIFVGGLISRRFGGLVVAMIMFPVVAVLEMGRLAVRGVLSPIGRRIIVASLVMGAAATGLIKIAEIAKPEIVLAAQQSDCRDEPDANMLFQVQWNTGKRYYSNPRFNKKSKWIEYETSEQVGREDNGGQPVTEVTKAIALAKLAKLSQHLRNDVEGRPSFKKAYADAQKWIRTTSDPTHGASKSFYLNDPNLPPDARIDIVNERGINLVH